MTVYTLELEVYDDNWMPKFAFTASDEQDALGKARSWGRYHSFYPGEIRVRKATENEAENWLHNEYIEWTS